MANGPFGTYDCRDVRRSAIPMPCRTRVHACSRRAESHSALRSRSALGARARRQTNRWLAASCSPACWSCVVGGLAIGLVGRRSARARHHRPHRIDHRASTSRASSSPTSRRMADGEWLNDEDKAAARLAADATRRSRERVVSLKVWRPGRRDRLQPRSRADRRAVPGRRRARRGAERHGRGRDERPRRRRERQRAGPASTACSRCTCPSASAAATGSSPWPSSTSCRPRSTSRSLGASCTSWLVVAVAVALVVPAAVRHRPPGQRHDRSAAAGAANARSRELSTLLDQNEQLRERVRAAAERNDDALRAQPAPDQQRPARRPGPDAGAGDAAAGAAARPKPTAEAEYDELQSALTDALRDMRSIAAGLRLPELETPLHRRHGPTRGRRSRPTQRHAGVAGDRRTPLRDAPLPTKIALFRAAPGAALQLDPPRQGRRRRGASWSARTAGCGPPFRTAGRGSTDDLVGAEGHLGLAGIREQAELLGGDVRDAARA